MKRSEMATLVELKEASFSHDTGPEILHQVSLSVQEGARIAVLGENGSGKSTLFRLLSGAWTPTSGELVIAGTPITRARRKKQARDFARAHVQLVLQEPDDQIFAMSVREDISFGPLNQGLTPEEVESRVDQAMMAAEVSELAEKVPHQLSYGQRKRVALAGALAMQPNVLMLDEPTAGLDPAGSRKLLRTIEGLEAAVVLSTHDVNLAYEFATDVVVLLDGRLTVGSCDHILSDTELLRKARLELPWAPVVSVALGRTVKRPEDVLWPLSKNMPANREFSEGEVAIQAGYTGGARRNLRLTIHVCVFRNMPVHGHVRATSQNSNESMCPLGDRLRGAALGVTLRCRVIDVAQPAGVGLYRCGTVPESHWIPSCAAHHRSRKWPGQLHR